MKSDYYIYCSASANSGMNSCPGAGGWPAICSHFQVLGLGLEWRDWLMIFDLWLLEWEATASAYFLSCDSTVSVLHSSGKDWFEQSYLTLLLTWSWVDMSTTVVDWLALWREVRWKRDQRQGQATVCTLHHSSEEKKWWVSIRAWLVELATIFSHE